MILFSFISLYRLARRFRKLRVKVTNKRAKCKENEFFLHFQTKRNRVSTIPFISAVDRHIHVLHRSTGTAWGDIGRDALLSWRGGNAHVAARVTFAWSASAQLFACLQVDRGCRSRPRNIYRCYGRCGSRSGRLSAIPDVLALSFRHDG